VKYIIDPSELGSGAAFVQNLYSSSRPARKGAYVKLRTLISILRPEIPISKLRFISVGCDSLGRGPVLILSFDGADALGDSSNVTES
jgi:hypothetical protein